MSDELGGEFVCYSPERMFLTVTFDVTHARYDVPIESCHGEGSANKASVNDEQK
jgi:hypothetical protein